jgi:hypothetical protein
VQPFAMACLAIRAADEISAMVPILKNYADRIGRIL